MSNKLKDCIKYWEMCDPDEVTEDVALAFIYLAEKLSPDKHGSTWERLSRRVKRWNKRFAKKGAA